MGQSLRRQRRPRSYNRVTRLPSIFDPKEKLPDLTEMPAELAYMVLSNLNAEDLCLAMCVNHLWSELSRDDLLWQGLCRGTWRYVSCYDRELEHGVTFMDLYLKLDEGTLTFNADAQMGVEYFIRHALIDDTPLALAKFIHNTNKLDRFQVRQLLTKRQDILQELVYLDDYKKKLLPNALRTFFSNIQSPGENGHQLQRLLEIFAERFVSCNPDCGLSKDGICILCYSLILLSVDLTSPHVKNKMSKREFIRNVRNATREANDELSGHLYDNIYLVGHIAPQRW
ncbi:F-box only protein 8-like [Asterias rubens]|uniref:F-box only protein 8-like n=1 Tax=Asterias rubens TaxID=7604 RepID=UPI0014555F9F|nr:F-box only protein 8-like [Asterias rubens]